MKTDKAFLKKLEAICVKARMTDTDSVCLSCKDYIRIRKLRGLAVTTNMSYTTRQSELAHYRLDFITPLFNKDQDQ